MMTDPSVSRPTVLAGDLGSCWFCGKAVSPRALFCHQCGSVQPPASVDAFTRLNLPRRFDLAQADLDRQVHGLSRVFDPLRFAGKGPRERELAERQRTALEQAGVMLRDPITRARHLLEIEGQNLPATPPRADWSIDLAVAVDLTAIDRFAARLGLELELVLRDLSTAFRLGNLHQAADLLRRAEDMQLAAETARRRRAELSSAKSAP
ncbi:molecular chaperone DnaJ [Oleisolibacter albus]|uniref:molecular chaperone DnaJ n=1 Tax=Oleisolibacter albus TaxID=2171757 RepID=UPI000DF397E9|nr:molecular chaperone DnaJ [Oleisolibacter albus]